MKNITLTMTLLTLASTAYAQFSVPNTFAPGGPIRAADMNANFGAVATQFNRSAAFVHTSSAANSVGNYTCVDHPLANNQPNAVVVFSRSWGNGGSMAYITSPFSAWYNGERWCIYLENNALTMPLDVKFNVMVFKP
ncbi:DUF7452 domain-containing protein [Deinococcus hopiensis]|uniref:DUF7452 domain-containing protein n=1 Tax=Deinococcus hopiensis KR-140 TaxID=695939 RepID=A0A1W1URW8_9DEIO|nr:hypothetical protein [Deinococcus hopiensis]SMB83783.1 hypothetical protein SAMN00790413_04890 [Deinococcus hopiensis KR-140]